MLRLGSISVVALLVASCGHLPGGHGLPGGSGEVDPDSCGNYAASDAGAKLKMFLQATKDLNATLIETTRLERESCIMMGKELGLDPGQFAGDDTKAICQNVIAAYQNNMKVGLKAGARLDIHYTPGQCTVDANASASASGACSGGAAAGNGGAGAGGQCAAAANVNASIHANCTPPELTIEARAGAVVDTSKVEMTLKAMRDGLPKLLSVAARIKPLQEAVTVWVESLKELQAMGPKFVQSFGDQAMCISGQLGAAASASTHIQANVSVSVSVSASASGSVGG